MRRKTAENAFPSVRQTARAAAQINRKAGISVAPRTSRSAFFTYDIKNPAALAVTLPKVKNQHKDPAASAVSETIRNLPSAAS